MRLRRILEAVPSCKLILKTHWSFHAFHLIFQLGINDINIHVERVGLEVVARSLLGSAAVWEVDLMFCILDDAVDLLQVEDEGFIHGKL